MNNRTRGRAVPEADWVKSSYSSGEGGECVEVAAGSGSVYVRDSKAADGPVLTVGPAAWSGFLAMAARLRG